MIHATAKKIWEVYTNLTETEFISFVDELLNKNGDQLDSLDLGDALGGIISIAESAEYSGDLEFHDSIWRWSSPASTFVIVAQSGYDIFEWEGLPA